MPARLPARDPAPAERLRPGAVAEEPLYRRVVDLLPAGAGWPAAEHLRGWRDLSRLRLRRRRRPRFRACLHGRPRAGPDHQYRYRTATFDPPRGGDDPGEARAGARPL